MSAGKKTPDTLPDESGTLPATSPYKLTISATSSGPGADGSNTVFQNILVEEYSPTASNSIEKVQAVAGAIMMAFAELGERAKKELAKK